MIKILLPTFVITALVYAIIGSPTLPAQPYSERGDEIRAVQTSILAMTALVQRLEERIATHPQDPEAHFYLGKVYAQLDNLEGAQQMFLTAQTLFPADDPKQAEISEILSEILNELSATLDK